MRQSLLSFLAFGAIVVAQDSSVPTVISSTDPSTSAPAPTSSATDSSASASATSIGTSISQGPITHTVAVALGGHTFAPDVTLAEVGDTILFQFYPTNHSVIRAEYGYPCIPYEDTGIDKVGFFSGFRPVDAILSSPPEWTLLINNTDPIFYYCGAPGSCINYEMVGVINPNATTSLQHQKDLASESQFMLTPGQPWPDESEDPFNTTATSSPTSTPSSTATAAPSSDNGGHSSLSTGAIAGIAIGGAAVAIAAAALLYLCGRNSRRSHQQMTDQAGMGHQSVAFNPANAHMSFMTDPNKHMSMHSSVAGYGPNMGTSPALPGYVPVGNDPMSPGMHPSYAPMSDSLNPMGPGSDGGTMYSTSPSPMYAVPAYNSGAPLMNPPHSPMYSSVPPANVHEMAGSEGITTPAASTPQGTGIMGFINRRSSTNKTGGVERYG